MMCQACKNRTATFEFQLCSDCYFNKPVRKKFEEIERLRSEAIKKTAYHVTSSWDASGAIEVTKVNFIDGSTSFQTSSSLPQSNRPQNTNIVVALQLEIDKPNKNGSIYTKEAISKAVEKYNEFIICRCAFGTLGTIENSVDGAASVTKLADVAFSVNDMWLDEHNNKIMVDIEIFGTKAGHTLSNTIDRDRTAGIKSIDFVPLLLNHQYQDQRIVTDCTIIRTIAVPAVPEIKS